MKNKNLYIGLGVLAVAGIGFYMWRKKDKAEDASETKTKIADASVSTQTPSKTPATTTSETPTNITTSSATGNFASERLCTTCRDDMNYPTLNATGNVASNAGNFTNRFIPSRTAVVPPRKNVVNQAIALDTLTKTNIGNIDVVPNRIAVVPIESIGNIGSNIGSGILSKVVPIQAF